LCDSRIASIGGRLLSAMPGAAIRLELGDLPPQPLDLQLLWLHLSVAGKSLRRIGGEIPNPLAQHVRVHVQIARRLRHADPTILDQANRLDLELPPKPSPSYPPPPASSNTQSWCPRNRQQASQIDDNAGAGEGNTLLPSAADGGS
jgi:hypothetical protein